MAIVCTLISIILAVSLYCVSKYRSLTGVPYGPRSGCFWEQEIGM